MQSNPSQGHLHIKEVNIEGSFNADMNTSSRGNERSSQRNISSSSMANKQVFTLDALSDSQRTVPERMISREQSKILYS